MKYLLLCLTGLFILSGCSSKKDFNNELFHQVTIMNKSSSDVKDATIYAYNTKRKMNCSLIPINGLCSYSFQKEVNPKNKFMLSWENHKKVYHYEYLLLDQTHIKNNDSINFRLHLYEDGKYEIATD